MERLLIVSNRLPVSVNKSVRRLYASDRALTKAQRSEAEHLGQAAREVVREKFLITRLLSDHLDIYNAVIGR
jgi:hypothetical protein